MTKLSEAGIKMTDVKANQGAKPVPNGPYHCVIQKYSEGRGSPESKYPGALQYKVGLKIADGEHKERWIFDTLTVEGDKARDNSGRLRALFEACGIDGDTIDDSDFDPDTEWGESNILERHVIADVFATKETAEYSAGNMVKAYHLYEFTDADLD